MITFRQHLNETKRHLLGAAALIEDEVRALDAAGEEVAGPLVAAALGIDFATLQGCDRLLFDLARDTAVDHLDAVKVAVLKTRHYRKPVMSPSAAARARA